MERQPIALRPDNFTPLTRTPWAGTRVLGRYKRAVLRGHDPEQRVGESWELSVSDEFPSTTLDGRLLRDVLAEQREAALGDEAKLGRDTTSLLVKWLDADDDLSLQIHPQDDYTGLGAGETGKVEAWYVVAAEPAAGFYFGFQPSVSGEDVRAAIAGEGDLRTCMQWVPAVPGDVALITPGLPHAVGRGLTLIEPQRVVPGKVALTYRYWDFGRRYDDRGQPSPSGKPRALHLDHALAVTAFEHVSDPAWLGARRARGVARARSLGAARVAGRRSRGRARAQRCTAHGATVRERRARAARAGHARRADRRRRRAARGQRPRCDAHRERNHGRPPRLPRRVDGPAFRGARAAVRDDRLGGRFAPGSPPARGACTQVDGSRLMHDIPPASGAAAVQSVNVR